MRTHIRHKKWRPLHGFIPYPERFRSGALCVFDFVDLHRLFWFSFDLCASTMGKGYIVKLFPFFVCYDVICNYECTQGVLFWNGLDSQSRSVSAYFKQSREESRFWDTSETCCSASGEITSIVSIVHDQLGKPRCSQNTKQLCPVETQSQCSPLMRTCLNNSIITFSSSAFNTSIWFF